MYCITTVRKDMVEMMKNLTVLYSCGHYYRPCAAVCCRLIDGGMQCLYSQQNASWYGNSDKSDRKLKEAMKKKLFLGVCFCVWFLGYFVCFIFYSGTAK